MRIPSNINQTEVGLFWLSNNNINRSFTQLKFIESRAERLIAFAIIPRYEKKPRFFNRRGCDYTLSCNQEYCMTIVWHQSMARESKRRRTLMTALVWQLTVFRGSIKLARYVAKSGVCCGLFSCTRVFHNMQNWHATCKRYPLLYFPVKITEFLWNSSFLKNCRVLL